ncbi:MAG: hypothetical protein R2798_08300 [Chitinophagales bacterium]|nr:hypothetical protein [Bacteroidota bacterium]MCB9042434.1 hypothetical protein [Chitinophagales bacterium]
MKQPNFDAIDNLWKERLENASAPVPENMWERIEHARHKKKFDFGVAWWILLPLGILGSIWFLNSQPNSNTETAKTNNKLLILEEAINEFVDTAVANNLEQNILPVTEDIVSAENDIKTISHKKTVVTTLAKKENLNALDNHFNSFFNTKNALTSATSHNTTQVSAYHLPKMAFPSFNSLEKQLPHTVFSNFSAKLLPPSNNDNDVGGFECPQDKRSNCGKWEIVGLGKVLYPQRHLSISGNNSSETAAETYLQTRKDTEKPEFAWSSGILAGRKFCSGLYLRTGVAFSQIHETFTYETPATQSTTITVTITTVQPDGTTSTQTYEQAANINGVRQITTYNKHQFWDIPLMLGYEKKLTKNTALQIESALWFNVWYKQRGTMIDYTTNLPANMQQAAYFKQSAGLSASLGINYVANIHKNWALVLGVEGRKMFKDLSNPNKHPLTQKYNLYGLNFGIKYAF